MVGMSENPVVMWNRDPAESPEAPLLVLFHGFGSNEQDLMGLVPQLPQDFVVASVRAPLAQPPGYSWFPLYDEEAFGPEAIRAAVELVASVLAARSSSATARPPPRPAPA